MIRTLVAACTLVLLSLCSNGQTVRLMSWNALNFSSASSDRVPYFQTVIDSMMPQLLVMQEIKEASGANYFHTAVLQSSMAMMPFVDGYDTDNALYYDSLEFKAVATLPILTTLRDISQFVLVHRPSGDTLRVFSVHLKSSSGSANQSQRLNEVNALRAVTDALPPDAYHLVCGDFNFYGSNEAAYQRLLEADGGTGYYLDPLPLSGTWNNAAFAPYHTQSPRVRAFGGGATSGLDDRFDLMLFSPNFSTSDDIEYVNGSTWAVGNDGLHYNDSINRPPNALVSQTMADALHYAADHLPLVASINFYNSVNVNEATKERQLLAYPNPSNGVFSVELPSGPSLPWQLVDMHGRILRTGNSQGSLTFDLSNEACGSYLLQTQHEGLLQTVKLMLK